MEDHDVVYGDDPPGFDVTCVIGHVTLVEDGVHSPYEAAILLIARHDTEGTFKFELNEMEHFITVERRDLRQVQ
jgi:hypothetical protein